MKKKLIPVILGLFTVIELIIPFSAIHATTQRKETPYTIDHVRNREKAKKWADQYCTDWTKFLSSAEKSSLKKLLELVDTDETNNLNHINHQLKVFRGDLSARPIDIPEENKILTDHVERISRAINRKEGRLAKPLMVYKNETFTEVLHTEDAYFRNPDHTLDEAKVSQLKENFLSALHSEFRIYDLFEDPNQDKMIKWKIELPPGTPTGLITEDQIIINKDSAFKVNDVKIIIQKGKQLIRIAAKLIPKKIVTKEINQITAQLQRDFLVYFNLPMDKKFIDFRLTGSASYVIAKKLEKFLNTFALTFNHSVLQKTLQFISHKNGYFIFTDQPLYSLPKIYGKNGRTLASVIWMMDLEAFYSFKKKILALNISHSLEQETERDTETLFHEFGHAVDNYAAQILETETNDLSQTPKFIKIFEKEGGNLTEYGATNPAEFFAEAFWMIHTAEHQNTVKEKSPLVYAFILQVLEVVADYEPKSFDTAT